MCAPPVVLLAKGERGVVLLDNGPQLVGGHEALCEKNGRIGITNRAWIFLTKPHGSVTGEIFASATALAQPQ